MNSITQNWIVQSSKLQMSWTTDQILFKEQSHYLKMNTSLAFSLRICLSRNSDGPWLEYVHNYDADPRARKSYLEDLECAWWYR